MGSGSVTPVRPTFGSRGASCDTRPMHKLSLLFVLGLTGCGAQVVFDGEGQGGQGGSSNGGAGPGPVGPGQTTSPSTTVTSTTTNSVTTVTTGPGGAPPTGSVCVIDENSVTPDCQNCFDGPANSACGALNEACNNSVECIDYASCLTNCNDQQPCCNGCEAQFPSGAKQYAEIVSCFVCQTCPQCADVFPGFCFFEG